MSKIFTSLIFKDKFSKIFFFSSLLLNFFIWGFLYLKFSSLSGARDLLPLHYNIYFGIDFVGKWYKIFIMPTTGIFFIIINFFVADIIYLRDKAISYFLTGASLFIQVMLVLAAMAIVSINQ